MAKIATDRRHASIRTLLEDPIDTRQFAEWTMGFERTDDAEASVPDGFRRSFDDLESGSDTNLMQQAARDLTAWFRARAQTA